MSTFFIGCLHLGHNKMAQWRGFKSSKEHDELIINNWNKVVTKRDLVFILGDVTMERPDYYYYLDELNGRKQVVLGNHDLPKHVPDLLKHVEAVAGMIDYKGFALTHCPIHPNELQFYPEGNIHAHIHHINKIPNQYCVAEYGKGMGTFSTENKYHHVDAKVIDFTPISLEEIREKLYNNG